MTNIVIEGNIQDLDKQKFIQSVSNPSQIGIVVLKSDGNDISGGGGGGGTSSSFSAVFPTTGTAIGFLDSTGTNMVPGNLDVSGNLKISGSVTANAGTNLNTSLLALESGGNIAGLNAKFSSLGQKLMTASTPVVIASDQSGVNTLAAQGTTVTGSLTTNSGAGSTVSASIGSYSVATITLKGTYTGATVTFQASDDSGTTYYQILASSSNSPSSAANSFALTNSTGNMFNVTLPGVTNVRVTCTAIASGSISVRITPTGDPMVFNVAAGLIGTPGINVSQINGTTAVTAKSGVLAIGGTDAVNVAPTANPNYIAGLGQSSEPAANTTARITPIMTDLYGHVVTSPYANRENFVKGNASATGTSDTAVIVTGGSGLKNYVTTVSIANTGATTATITIKDGSGGSTLWQTIAPAGGGSNIMIDPPISGTANTAVYFASGSSSSTVYCSMSGYKGA